tara:strand:- start:533 stop:2014 length:1482 start_codon:yes stop_codon:yes gene_type:complete
MSGIKLGLHPLHLGLVNGQWIAPPSEFALATIGTRRRKTLDGIVKSICDDVNAGALDVGDTPLLAHYIEQKEFDINTLASLVQKKEGSQKFIIQSSVLPVSKGAQELVTISPRPQLIIKIDSRGLDEKKKRDEQKVYDVHIFNHSELPYVNFTGGTFHSAVTLARGIHWNKNIPNERAYLDSLKTTKNKPNIARKQLTRHLEVIDYARASALIALEEIIRCGHHNKIRFSGSMDLDPVELPFDFSIKRSGERFGRMKYAMEAMLLRYASPKVIREITGHKTGRITLAEIDSTLLGKRIVPGHVHKYLAQGEITKGVMLYNKSFRNHRWPIIQALEKHYFQDRRNFQGYSLEFAGTKYQTTSIVFDLPARSAKAGRDISMRILFDENFNPPVVNYKVKVTDPRQCKGLKHLSTINPMKMINWPVGRQNEEYTTSYLDTDWRTGELMVCTLREATDGILDVASRITRNLPRVRNVSAFEMRGWYMDADKERRKGK